MSISQAGSHFFIESPDTTYCFAIPDDGGLPVNIYWGPAGISAEDFPTSPPDSGVVTPLLSKSVTAPFSTNCRCFSEKICLNAL